MGLEIKHSGAGEGLLLHFFCKIHLINTVKIDNKYIDACSWGNYG
jgi:hypothetical protein